MGKGKPKKEYKPRKGTMAEKILQVFDSGIIARKDIYEKVGCSKELVQVVLQRAGKTGEGRKEALDKAKERVKGYRKKDEEKILARIEKQNQEKKLSSDEEKILAIMKRWRADMACFVEEAMGINGQDKYFITKQQRDACNAVSDLIYTKQAVKFGWPMEEVHKEMIDKIGISIMSGQGPGKDAWLSWFIVWFMFCFQNVLIPCTAPGADQLKNILWSEVSRWLERRDSNGNYLVVPLVRERIIVQGDKIYIKDFGGSKNFAFPKTANPKDDPEAQAKTLYGYHEEFMAIVVDEAALVNNPVFKPLEGTLTGLCNFIIMAFNPVKSSGFAVESHIGTQSHKWVKLHWDAEESEIVSKQHITDMEEKYGRGSNTFRTLVRGLPPLAEPDTLIPYDWVMDAVVREIVPMDDDPHIGFVDVGGGGDNSIYTHRHGMKVYPQKKFSSPDTMKVVQWACQCFDDDDLDIMGIDNIGIGAGVYYRMKELGYKVRMVDNRRIARDEERFGNVRSESWWIGREVFEAGTISIPDDQFLKEELWSPKFDREGKKIKIEPKKTMKKRLGLSRSPNNADSLLGCLYIKDSMYRHKMADYDDEDERIMRNIIPYRNKADRNAWMGV